MSEVDKPPAERTAHWGWLAGLLLAVPAGWAVLYALGALDIYLVLRRYSPVTYLTIYGEYLPAIAIWILLTPLVVRLHREREARVGRGLRLVGEHLLLGLGLTGLLATLEILRLLWRFELPLTALPTVIWKFSNLRMLQHAGNYALVIVVVLFADFYRTVRSGERQAQRLRTELTGAQLSAIRAKLHPHFLFNTFNAIASLVRTNRNDQAVTMIADISALLRHTLENHEKAEVTFQTELDFINRYLDIEQARFTERLTYRRAVAVSVLPAAIPNMLVQPLVENAIKHGISCDTQPGWIELKASRSGADLVIEVRNSRPPAERSLGATASLGIGLSSIRDRLHQAYGHRAQLQIDATREDLYAVTISLPFHLLPT